MTARRDLKAIIRERQQKTGESYTAARAHVMRQRAELLGLPPEKPKPATEERIDAAILKVNSRSVRVRLLGSDEQLTYRTSDVWKVVPGQVVTLAIKRRWLWRGDACASGKLETIRIDARRLGLSPLPLDGGELDDISETTEPYRRPDPYAPLWRKFTAKPRPSYEFDGIAWGALPGLDEEENPTCDAAELVEMGDIEGAQDILMDVLATDLRCLDAHAHLGNLEFDHFPERALAHYEVGIRIGELSLPEGFDGLLVWGRIYNRPFLRCLHGFGLCLWRLGKAEEARRAFERILSLNPSDNQGVRFCWEDVRNGMSWQESQDREEAAYAARSGRAH